jgi:two-component system nitrate/nitrite response regulator NarL
MKAFFRFLISILLPQALLKAADKTRREWEDFSRQYEQTIEAPESKTVRVVTIYEQDPLVVFWNSLTPREREVVALVCLGHRNYEIAQVLGISPNTIKGYLENIFPKLRVQDRTEIRLMFRDWDFQAWWMNRHILPAELPVPHR